MGAGLYDHVPAFTTAMDGAFDAFEDGPRLRADWLSATPRVDIHDAARAQPLLLAVDHALGQTILSWGVEPGALLGHSVGETAAAVLAGVFTFAEAAAMTARRVRRARGVPPGGMLAVAATVEEISHLLDTEVAVGAVNAPRQVMLAGPETPLRIVEQRLRRRGYTCRRIASHTAFHSPAVRAVANPADLAGIVLRPPGRTLYSGYTGALLSPAQAVDPGFWVTHPVAPVLFWPALDAMLSVAPTIAIEAGPGRLLHRIALRHRCTVSGRGAAWAMLPARPGTPEQDRQALDETAGRLREEGYPVPHR
jgi:acyl transferase domain-containing protein